MSTNENDGIIFYSDSNIATLTWPFENNIPSIMFTVRINTPASATLEEKKAAVRAEVSAIIKWVGRGSGQDGLPFAHGDTSQPEFNQG